MVRPIGFVPGKDKIAPARSGVDRPSRERLCELARTNLRARRMRSRHLPGPIFGEPAWDMLLALYLSDQGEARQTVSRLTESSGAPPTTAARWIDYLVRNGFASRRVSATDKRVAFVDLTDKGRQSVEAFLSDLIAEGMAPPPTI